MRKFTFQTPPVIMRSADAAVAGAAVRDIAPDWHAWFDGRRSTVDAALATHLDEVARTVSPHGRLADSVVYSVRAGGKRLRPILVLECCRLCGGEDAAALPAALAMEFVHTFSLIHDDLPAMDNDDLRRGQPTNHKVFGEATAILAGDWLLARALGLLTSAAVPRSAVAEAVATLARGTEAMIEGQDADMAGESRPPEQALVDYIHAHKTAALLETSCRLGALCAGAATTAVAALGTYGQHLGIAFQIADDLLDARGTVEQMGKAVGKDAAANKQTSPAVLGIAASEARAHAEVTHALTALETFGAAADRLRDLARYVVRREH